MNDTFNRATHAWCCVLPLSPHPGTDPSSFTSGIFACGSAAGSSCIRYSAVCTCTFICICITQYFVYLVYLRMYMCIFGCIGHLSQGNVSLYVHVCIYCLYIQHVCKELCSFGHVHICMYMREGPCADSLASMCLCTSCTLRNRLALHTLSMATWALSPRV